MADSTPIPAPASVVEACNKVIELSRPTVPLYEKLGPGAAWSYLMKESGVDTSKPLPIKDGESVIKDWTGLKMHPFNMAATAMFKNSNGHHSTCIETKVGSTVGLGFVSEPVDPMDPLKGKTKSKVAKALDPLVRGVAHTFQDLLTPLADDYWSNGNAYLEVVRDESDVIVGLHFIEARRVFVWVEENGYDLHYYVLGVPGSTTGDARFAKFGDLKDFRRRMGTAYMNPAGKVSELIHFRRATSLSRFYGWPDWLAAVAAIELTQMMHQERFDFFLNRGVPEFMLFIMGTTLPPEDWKKVEDSLKANIGLGNSHKSIALNLTGAADSMKVQLEKLAVEGSGGGDKMFSEMHETLALEIVSAHRMPPPLAGIIVPGRVGSNNELPNALLSCQALVVGPAQHTFSTILGMTLGHETLGVKGLTEDDFKLNTITEFINTAMGPGPLDANGEAMTPQGAAGSGGGASGMQRLSTMGRMRQTVTQAKAQGRNLSDGIKKEIAGIDLNEEPEEISDDEAGEAFGALCSLALKRMVESSRRAAAAAA